MLRKIEDYQLQELQNDMLYINTYDLSLEYSYELSIYWKELFFDIFQSLAENGYALNFDALELENVSLFNYMKQHYKEIIKDYELNINIVNDYIEINDYIPYSEWAKNPDNGLAFFPSGTYLVTKSVDCGI